jgi:hypothetical protein
MGCNAMKTNNKQVVYLKKQKKKLVSKVRVFVQTKLFALFTFEHGTFESE